MACAKSLIEHVVQIACETINTKLFWQNYSAKQSAQNMNVQLYGLCCTYIFCVSQTIVVDSINEWQRRYEESKQKRQKY